LRIIAITQLCTYSFCSLIFLFVLWEKRLTIQEQQKLNYAPRLLSLRRVESIVGVMTHESLGGGSRVWVYWYCISTSLLWDMKDSSYKIRWTNDFSVYICDCW